jgi:hypothetical protein
MEINEDTNRQIKIARGLLYDLISMNQQVSGDIWGSALWNTIVVGYLSADGVFEDFEREILRSLKFLKEDWPRLKEELGGMVNDAL